MAFIEEFVPAIPWVELENHRFISILRRLDQKGWRRPSYCPGWSAAGVVAHMTLGALFYSHVITAGREGRLEMPFGSKDLKSFWAYREREGAELASLPDNERVDRFEDAVWNLQAIFMMLRPNDLEKKAWHWMCPCPLHSYPGQRLFELILHDWDIQNNPKIDLRSDALGAAVDILDFRLPFFLNHNRDPELTGSFRLETDKPSRRWAMCVEAGIARPVSPKERAFDAEIFTSSSDLILLTTGRANLEKKKEAGCLRVKGNVKLADILLEVLCRSF